MVCSFDDFEAIFALEEVDEFACLLKGDGLVVVSVDDHDRDLYLFCECKEVVF